MEAKLIPCPFCGGEAQIEKTVPHLNPTQYFGHCLTCRIESDLYDTEEEAIKAWNKRVAFEDGGLVGELVDVLEKEAILISEAILSTPTGESRNKLTNENILRRQLIAKAKEML